MPELPEVETVARKLRKAITGKRIAGLRLSGKSLRRPMPRDLAAVLEGRTVRAIHRRGKYLILEMEPQAYWLIHLGMSGRLIYASGSTDCPRHTHAVIRFTDGAELKFCDPRRFGLMDVYQAPTLDALPEVGRLGKDPLGVDFKADWLFHELAVSRRELKSFLLDQRKISGLGNIYVCEAMFRARLHPARRCHTITAKGAAALAGAIREVLRDAIRHRGTSFSDFIDSDGEPGAHQDFLQVFQQDGKRCPRCRALIRRMRQANRSTYYCPRCQLLGSTTKKGGSRDRRI